MFKLMDVSFAKAYSDEPFHSLNSFNVIWLISIAGIHFAYISCWCYTTAKKKRPNQLGYLVGIWL